MKRISEYENQGLYDAHVEQQQRTGVPRRVLIIIRYVQHKKPYHGPLPP